MPVYITKDVLPIYFRKLHNYLTVVSINPSIKTLFFFPSVNAIYQKEWDIFEVMMKEKQLDTANSSMPPSTY